MRKFFVRWLGAAMTPVLVMLVRRMWRSRQFDRRVRRLQEKFSSLDATPHPY
jgi:hypothetical protein